LDELVIVEQIDFQEVGEKQVYKSRTRKDGESKKVYCEEGGLRGMQLIRN